MPDLTYATREPGPHSAYSEGGVTLMVEQTAPSNHPPIDLTAIFNRLGRDHFQQCASRNMQPKGSSEWHRFDQGRWAFREAAISVNRATGYTFDVYGAWLDEWTPADPEGPVR